jgi:hypothetical protein
MWTSSSSRAQSWRFRAATGTSTHATGPRQAGQHEDLAVQARDSDRFAYLKAQGYKVVVIWECEIERDPEWVWSLLRSLKP